MYPNHNIYQHQYDQTSYDHSTPYQTEQYDQTPYDHSTPYQTEQYDQMLYDHSIPYQTEHYIPEVYDQRSFPMFPSQGGPMGPPPGPPGMGGPSQGFQSGPPSSPPPSFVPAHSQQQFGTFAVDPGSIRGCLFRYTYVWLNNRQQFWYFPTFVGRTSISGWRWTGFNWVFFGVGLRQIQSFTCV